MLRLLNPPVQGLCRIPRVHVDLGLPDHRSSVHGLVDPVYRATGLRHPGLPSLLPRLQSGKRGQKRRVNVEDSPGKSVQQRLLQHPHVAGQNDQVSPGLTQGLGQLLFDLRFQLGAVRARAAGKDRQFSLAGQAEDGRFRQITRHQNNSRRDLLFSDGLGQGDEIAALAGAQHPQPQGPHDLALARTAVVDLPGVSCKTRICPPAFFTAACSSASRSSGR